MSCTWKKLHDQPGGACYCDTADQDAADRHPQSAAHNKPQQVSACCPKRPPRPHLHSSLTNRFAKAKQSSRVGLAD